MALEARPSISAGSDTAAGTRLVYQLGARNPTPTFYDFFDLDYKVPAQRAVRLLALLDEKEVRVVVINLAPEFSSPIAAPL